MQHQGLSEEEVRAAAACAGEEVMIRNQFSEMNAPKDGSSVSKYVHLLCRLITFLCCLFMFEVDVCTLGLLLVILNNFICYLSIVALYKYMCV